MTKFIYTQAMESELGQKCFDSIVMDITTNLVAAILENHRISSHLKNNNVTIWNVIAKYEDKEMHDLM